MDMINGKAFKPEEWSTAGTPIIRIQNLNNQNAPFNHCKAALDPKYNVQNGDFLISWSGTPGTSFGAFIWTRGFAYLNQHIFRCELVDGLFLKEFLRLAINARLDEMISQAHGAVGLRHITKGKLESIRLPLPPLAEQKRIVAKVDELMALCDTLEAQQQERDTRHAALSRAALARFAEAPNAGNLELLFDQSFAIAPTDVRASVITMGVRGKLVPQDSSEGDARQQIDRAMERRRKAIETKGLRRKALDESAALAKRDDLPASWCVERFANLVDPKNTISYGVLVPGDDVADGVPFVRAQDLCLANHPPRPNKTISPEIEKPYARTRLVGGEILLCVVGSIGKLGTVPDSWAGANIARAVARIQPIPEILRDYLLLVLQERSVQSYFLTSTRTLAQPTLNVGMIEQTPIPVPPLAEQRRIVAKVDELMVLVDQLEAQLAAARAKGEKFLEAAVAQCVKGFGSVTSPEPASALPTGRRSG
jgi:type I restriction enzyme S subunit